MNNKRVDLRDLRDLRDQRLLLETRTIQNLDRLEHRRGVEKPTQIALIAQISQNDSVKTNVFETFRGALKREATLRSYLDDLQFVKTIF